ncbi:MAG TPA: hypothetical protein VK812_20305 [Candidatus Binatus sp.]|jgi:hypothetical protein|nr:hypothetical protein [Candidatus Binatus sp.]
MIHPVSSAAPAQPAAQASTVVPTSSKAAAQPSAPDTVRISTASQTLLQESLETSAQTAREARGGDGQAIRLLAKEAAAKGSAK